MSASMTSPLERQIAHVRRRLVLQALLDALTWAWAIALLLSAAWFLLERHVVHDAPVWLRWAVAGGALGVGAVTALLFAWLFSPPPLKAALVLDARCNLKERATTCLGLTPREADSPAGCALIADVNQRVTALPIAERFPVRFNWSAIALPAAAVVLVLLGIVYRSNHTGVVAIDGSKPLTDDPALKLAIDRSKKELLEPANDKKVDRRRDPELKKLDGQLVQLAEEPTDTEDQANKFIKDTAKAEDALRNAEKQLADRDDALKDRLRQEDRLHPERLTKKNGPGKNLQDAMKDGDFQRAAGALEELSKLLDPEQQKRIAEKLDKVKEKLGDLGLTPEECARLDEEIKKLKDELLTEEKKQDIQEALRELEKALDELAKPEEQEKQLKEQLAEQIAEAEKQAQQHEQERLRAEEQAKELQKKVADLANNPEERKKAEEELKKANEKAEELAEAREGRTAAGRSPAGADTPRTGGDEEQQPAPQPADEGRFERPRQTAGRVRRGDEGRQRR